MRKIEKTSWMVLLLVVASCGSGPVEKASLAISNCSAESNTNTSLIGSIKINDRLKHVLRLTGIGLAKQPALGKLTNIVESHTTRFLIDKRDEDTVQIHLDTEGAASELASALRTVAEVKFICAVP
jgi:hypothetical protein